jgi:hypothetical protein
LRTISGAVPPKECPMALSSLQHILIQPSDLEATKDWYVNVLGLTVGDHPDF